jgi:hypothetical protein
MLHILNGVTRIKRNLIRSANVNTEQQQMLHILNVATRIKRNLIRSANVNTEQCTSQGFPLFPLLTVLQPTVARRMRARFSPLCPSRFCPSFRFLLCVRHRGGNIMAEKHRGMSNGDRLCGLVVRIPGYKSSHPGFDSRRYQIF